MGLPPTPDHGQRTASANSAHWCCIEHGTADYASGTLCSQAKETFAPLSMSGRHNNFDLTKMFGLRAGLRSMDCTAGWQAQREPPPRAPEGNGRSDVSFAGTLL